jgi:hypothetical protein
MKTFFFGLFLGIVLTLIVNYIYSFIKSLSGSMEPQVYSDELVRSKIEGYFSFPLPYSAGRLFYREEGFQDAKYLIGLSLPSKEAWQLIQAYTGKGKSSFHTLKNDHSIFSYDIKKPNLWNLAELKEPLIYEIEETGSYKAIVYDEPTGRLLIHAFSM